ncbi:MAG: DUF4065 domain-containing protein [Candidatus Delongbacteria bacterium]|nr:DUF4065 domain-containing protein [Candidatus Delongbacteria bacterium]
MERIDPKLLAEYILGKIGDMPHFKLQKLLYYVNAWHLANFDEPLFDEEFEAWVHGPVLRSVWNEYKDVLGLMTVNNVVCVSEDIKAKVDQSIKRLLLPDQIELIDDVLDEYGVETAYRLECYTHSETPWREARKGLGPTDVCTGHISTATTREYYKERLMTIDE